MAQVELEKVTEVFYLLVESSTETILSIQTQTKPTAAKVGRYTLLSKGISDGRQPGLQRHRCLRPHTRQPTEPNMTSLKP